MDNKTEISKALVILLDLRKEDEKELMKLKVDVLNRIFDGQRKNALAYNNMLEISKKK